ncbi:phosphotransferase [Paractinoplanes maris]|uniref:phosphotransferase n=1 Tax=Paractinoplanes maris TaxID=1734446 RepID=UPI0020205139|nr:phosphotransferase [Actinoplanes maris]
MTVEQVVGRFGLGSLVAAPVKVAGGLSNEMWRVATSAGAYAVKRMVVNAGLPEFVENVEGAFLVEQRAWAAGVGMPEPIAEPGSGRALVRIDGELFRVHRWVSGRAVEDGKARGPRTAGEVEEAATLLAGIHAVGRPRWAATPDDAWDGRRWSAEIGGLAERVQQHPGQMLIVDSHRDLDRKNALRGADGRLLALDWDAAGPTGAAHEAVAVALDWAGDDYDDFAAAVAVYRRSSGLVIDAEPWVFGGWVMALGGWLDYNADHRGGVEIGRAEVAATRKRLHVFAENLDAWIAALARA